GTFTGAIEDRAGLIEKANGGILFLDEIHNLPSEGQEMLFLFMDTGYFRRFGEVSKEIKSDVRIICATNENINKRLLSTFLRRISVKIRIPSLAERGLDERLTLIEQFLKEESINLGKPIYISYNTMLCFLSYDCPYNIGQLRSDIKLTVANAYTEYFINNKKHIKINSPDLPKYMLKNISNSLLEERVLLNNLHTVNRYYIYDKNSDITSYSYQKQKQSICKAYLNLIYQVELISSNKSSTYIDFNNLLKEYFNCIQSNFEDYNYKFSYTTFDEINTALCNFNMAIDSFFKHQMYENLFNIHIDLVYDRLSFIDYDTSELKIKFKELFPYEYDLAINYLTIMEDNLNLYLPASEFILIMLVCIYILNFQNI
ncbi:MAG: sigma 54-interacting transcriptional regulator, partial [Paraclostridium sp.]